MQKLIETIQMLRQKLPKLRGTDLKEFPTRTILINPLLEALGWDVADPEEVQLEYSTWGGKLVDYALLLNAQPVLLVEAKPLDDPLEDVKAITQVVGYAANAGIEWCILTNGALWRVYKSMEKCPAEDKLLFEVDIDPQSPEGQTVEEIARRMWLFSREEMAENTLDAIGEQKFTDSKVRKALQTLLANPPKKLLFLLKQAVGDGTLKFPQIKESLARIMQHESWLAGVESLPSVSPKASSAKPDRSEGARKAWQSRRTDRPDKKGARIYDEQFHLKGKPPEIVALYHQLDQFCMELDPGMISKIPRKLYIGYQYHGHNVCCVGLGRILKIWLQVRYSDISDPPSFVRDVSTISHWGIGDTEVRIKDSSQLSEAKSLIRLVFEKVKQKA
ncbi:MAG TPA: type I restriction enzyme HsdR N-terminal domain-containing protein [Thermoguttaceae bacterium]|nr:type I restriction enzyme HsdR N-terminal domain-containing protein [Thermoguttaceae bacterium]